MIWLQVLREIGFISAVQASSQFAAQRSPHCAHYGEAATLSLSFGINLNVTLKLYF